MLIRAELEAIRARPRVSALGPARTRTAIGLVEATAVDEVAVEAITDAEARRAGAGSRDELLARLARHPERPLLCGDRHTCRSTRRRRGDTVSPCPAARFTSSPSCTSPT